MAHLEIETPDGTRHVTLAGEQMTIGRLNYNDVMLPYAQISRQHVALRRVTGQWRLVDLQSTNGVQLNGRRVAEHTLVDGDTAVLAPGILLTYLASDIADSAAETQTHILPSPVPVAPQRAAFAPAQVPPPSPTLGPTASPRLPAPQVPPAAESYPSARIPSQHTAPPLPTATDANSMPSPIPPSRARSVFADDEVPFAPPTMLPPAAAQRPGASTAPVVPNYSRASAGPIATNPTPTPPQREGSGGYPAPRGPFSTSGPNDSRDPYHRSGSTQERNGTPSGSISTLLHVCQTCGQLTAPDAVYCQSCHSSIAHDCVNCRLSLLPVQERCPRCHTPNSASVRRAHGSH